MNMARASSLRVNSDGEPTWLWRAAWDWPRPAQLEPESQVLVEPELVDVGVSDLPAEVDFSAPLDARRAGAGAAPGAGVRDRARAGD